MPQRINGMRKLWVLCLLMALTSCNWFTSKEEKVQEKIDLDMQEINWNDVDVYPMFADCDETLVKTEQKACFERTFLAYFSEHLEQTGFIKEATTEGVITIDFSIDNTGEIGIIAIENDSLVTAQFPDFNADIIQILDEMPKVEPALKRGIPVRAKFRFPIVLNTK